MLAIAVPEHAFLLGLVALNVLEFRELCFPVMFVLLLFFSHDVDLSLSVLDVLGAFVVKRSVIVLALRCLAGLLRCTINHFQLMTLL